jgi:hypothetical protein
MELNSKGATQHNAATGPLPTLPAYATKFEYLDGVETLKAVLGPVLGIVPPFETKMDTFKTLCSSLPILFWIFSRLLSINNMNLMMYDMSRAMDPR